jgi:hypothetical protein
MHPRLRIKAEKKKKLYDVLNNQGETHRMANFLGLIIRGGNRMKQMHIAKQARAPRLHPAKMSIRSHLVTVYNAGPVRTRALSIK